MAMSDSMNKPWVEAIDCVSTALLLVTLLRQARMRSRTAPGLF
jgi:hypothetical protein